MNPDCRRAGLLELRPGRVPLGRGHELRDAAGHGRRRDAHRHLAGAHARPGADAARAERRRRATGQRLLRVHGRPRPLHRLREARSDGRDRAPRSGDASARPLRAERRRRRGRLSALRARGARSPRRSTTGTTETTSTASISARASGSTRPPAGGRASSRRSRSGGPGRRRSTRRRSRRSASSPGRPGAALSYRAPAAGWYLLDVRLVHASRGPVPARRHEDALTQPVLRRRAARPRARRAAPAPGSRRRRRAAARPSSRRHRRRRRRPRRSRSPGR